jgi:hypothetical protein
MDNRGQTTKSNRWPTWPLTSAVHFRTGSDHFSGAQCLQQRSVAVAALVTGIIDDDFIPQG